jgi:GNAT superfamily N-acetyltransferase
VKVGRFEDRYEEIAAIHNLPAVELRSLDLRRPQPLLRWVAKDDGQAIATATTLLRPDQRRIVSFLGSAAAIEPLTAAVSARFDANLYASAAADDVDVVAALDRSGFRLEAAFEDFEVSFDTAIAAIRRAFVPIGFSIAPARQVDRSQLFELDNHIRSRIPGMQGWRGNWDWFVGELDDPAAYLVAIDDSSGKPAGLARIWQNDAGPRFGLIGVAAEFLGSQLGPGLLRRVLETAATWGHRTFTAETGTSNRYTHARLAVLADRSLGTRLQMVRG